MVQTHPAHAAALHNLVGSARTLLGEAAFPADRALNGAGAPTVLPTMHWVVNAVLLGLIGPEAALYRYWMEWCASNHSAGPVNGGRPAADW